MNWLWYILAGMAGVGGLVLLAKWLGGKKGDLALAMETQRASDALSKASELIGKRAAAEAKGEEDKKRIEDKLAIKDPIERLEALANELKDL